MMNKINQYDNDKALVAWEEWKEKCFVILVSTEGKYGDLRSILRKLIYSAFRSKFEKICQDHVDEIMNDPYFLKKTEDIRILKELEDNYWSTEFDQGIIYTKPPEDFMQELKKETGSAEDLVKCYKDFVWYKKEHSSDSPLVVIQGKLIGPQSIINGIAERYLKDNHYTLWLGYDLNKKRGKHDEAKIESKQPKKKSNVLRKESVSIISFQDSVGNSGDPSLTYADTIPDNKATDFTSQVSEAELEKELESFSREDIALIFANMAKMATASVTENFIGWKHDKISKYWNNYLKKKCRKYSILSDAKTIFLLKKRIESENNSDEFMSVVGTALQERLKRMEKGEEE